MHSSGRRIRNNEASVYVGNLDARVTEELLYELMCQCGPIVDIFLPKDKISGLHQQYGFIEYKNIEDANYAIKIMNAIKLYNRILKVNKSNRDSSNYDYKNEINAKLYIKNIHLQMNEQLLKDTFSIFGRIVNCTIIRNNKSNKTCNYGFIQYDNFTSSDLAIEKLNGQYIMNLPIYVTYAFKDGSTTDRHGDESERNIAKQQQIQAQKIQMQYMNMKPLKN